MALNMLEHIPFSDCAFDYAFFAQLCYDLCENNTEESETLAPAIVSSSAIMRFLQLLLHTLCYLVRNMLEIMYFQIMLFW